MLRLLEFGERWGERSEEHEGRIDGEERLRKREATAMNELSGWTWLSGVPEGRTMPGNASSIHEFRMSSGTENSTRNSFLYAGERIDPRLAHLEASQNGYRSCSGVHLELERRIASNKVIFISTTKNV